MIDTQCVCVWIESIAARTGVRCIYACVFVMMLVWYIGSSSDQINFCRIFFFSLKKWKFFLIFFFYVCKFWFAPMVHWYVSILICTPSNETGRTDVTDRKLILIFSSSFYICMSRTHDEWWGIWYFIYWFLLF